MTVTPALVRRRRAAPAAAGGGGGAVTITNVTGTQTQGSTLTLTGTGFGSHADYGGAQSFLCAGWNDFQSALDGGNWVRDGFHNANLSLQTVGALGGAATQFYRKINDGTSRQGSVSLDITGSNRNFYTSFWYKYSAAIPASSKWYRHYFDNPNGDFYFGQGDASSTSEATYLPGFNATGIARFNDSAVHAMNSIDNTWEFREIIAIMNSGATVWGSNDYLELRVNGTRVMRRGSGLPSLHVPIEGSDSDERDQWVGAADGASDGHTIDLGDLLEDGGGAGVWHMDFADVYASFTPARAMLGSHSTFTACTAFHMQPPLSWSTTSIQVQANRGGFAAFSGRYLYVVNASNQVNASGYAL